MFRPHAFASRSLVWRADEPPTVRGWAGKKETRALGRAGSQPGGCLLRDPSRGFISRRALAVGAAIRVGVESIRQAGRSGRRRGLTQTCIGAREAALGWIAGATAVRQCQFICSGAATANITPQKTSELADSFDEVPRMRIGKTSAERYSTRTRNICKPARSASSQAFRRNWKQMT